MRNFSLRIFSLALVVTMVLSSFPIGAFAESNTSNLQLTVESVSAIAGDTFDVDISLANNPGITSMKLNVQFGDILQLESVTYNAAFGGFLTDPETMDNPVTLTWVNAFETCYLNDTFATLTFTLNESATVDQIADIIITYDPEDIYDMSETNVYAEVENGSVTVIETLPGDINGDQAVNNKDVTRLCQFLANWDVEVNEVTLDTNNDGSINNKDLTRLLQYLANWDVEIYCGGSASKKCDHTLVKTEGILPTCEQDGNVEYWTCTKCGEVYKDSVGLEKTSLANTILPATGHTIVIDPAVAATYDSTGLTEGSHCSICGKVIKEQEVTPKLKGFAITYNIANGDSYLAQQAIDNSKNPVEYNPTQEDITLANLVAPDGYKFLGWFDGAGNNAVQIKKIDCSEKANVELYAHWEINTYTISFKSDMVPLADIEASANTEEVLPSLTLDKYTFVGWTNKDGELVTEIPKGQTENITLYANWLSNRNRAVGVSELGEPIVAEDSENGLILFTYEIGTIENVPLFTTLNLNCVNGLISTTEQTHTKEISNTAAENIAETIATATTDSTSWSLSSDWNETTEISEDYLEETGQTKEEVEELVKNESNEYSLVYNTGGKSGSTKVDGSSTTTTDNTAHSNTDSSESNTSSSIAVDTSASAKFKGGAFGCGVEVSTDVSMNRDWTDSDTKTTSGTTSGYTTNESVTNSSSVTTNEKSWNVDEGYTSSQSTSESTAISNAISSLISQKYGYGKSYSQGGSNNEAKELASTVSNGSEYSSAFTYYSSEIESTTTSFESTGNTTGDYRMVMAGKAHVFAVVGYDVAKKAYFVYTYSMLDEETYEYLDYSFDGSYNDYEASYLPFAVPSFVNDFVNSRTMKTKGITDSYSGLVEEYIVPTGETPSSIMYIPSYMSLDNGDGEFTAVKVTEISSNLLKDCKEDVQALNLSQFITDIPNSMFEGCTNLEYVTGLSIQKIGANAFAGCSNLKEFTVSTGITAIGENAFDGVPSINVTAANAEVAKSIASTGAQNTVLDISCVDFSKTNEMPLAVGDVEQFELRGKNGQYNNVSIVSDATATVLNGITFNNTLQIPIETSSNQLTLNRVNVNSNAYSMLLKNENTNIFVNSDVRLSSQSGNAIVCKNITISPLNAGVAGKLIVNGTMLVCGTITGEQYLKCDNIVYISEDEYENYAKGMSTITLDANGGQVSQNNIVAFYGAPIGELPEPTFAYHTFDGWFTEVEGGKEYTKTTVNKNIVDITLYAHWSPNTATITFNANEGNVAENEKAVAYKECFGTLPTPTRDYYTFDGWYTAINDGELVTAETIKEDDVDATLYAHWSENAVSDWVLESELPDNAQVIDTKWTYTETTTATSTDTVMDGFTCINSYWQESAQGNFEYSNEFPAGFDTTNPLYSLAKAPYAAEETETTKREVSTGHVGYIYWHWMFDCGGNNAGNRTILDHYGRGTNYNYTIFGAFASSASYDVYGNDPLGTIYYNTGRTSYADSQGTHYWFRFNYYNCSYTDYVKYFDYERIENKESDTEIQTAENISNIQKFVTYKML